ncbi:hypothetical protein BCR42DRAFT_424141 [Absidia repens]|uniref:RRM domain-containing protein n=1 Tax=Absidia repens TaxID=90262 RepID=A0A1X2I4Q3_9FUNG|nr:hypothetical protein BCR42DRAFT_424141 [Absidia repens]
MSGKKKAQKQKMSLSDFLADESSGSWADEMSDLPSAPSVVREDGGAFGGNGGRFDRGDDLPRNPARSNGHRYGDREDRHEGGGGFRGRERSFPPRDPVALPSEPPFTAHIGNLSFDVNDDDVADFFSEMKIVHIRIMRDFRNNDRSKGYGYIEFQDLQSLKSALELNGEPLQNRSIRINLADPPKERTERPERHERHERHERQDRTNVGTWRRESPVVLPGRERQDRPERHGGFRDRYERPERTFNDQRGSDTSWSGGAFSNNNSRRRDFPPPAAERPRLHLLPRTVGGTKTNTTTKPSSTKSNPFGQAKPVDTNKALERVETKIQHLKVDDDKN